MRPKNINFLIPLITLVLIILQSGLYGQQLSFRNYTVREGLPQSEVHSMVQDNNGYIWCSTMNGISRFDGNEFKNYTKNDGLAGIESYLAIKDNKGNLWFGHGNGTLTKLDVSSNLFSKIYLLENEKEASGLYINCIIQDKYDRIWVGTQGKGVFYIENNIVHNISDQHGLPDNDVLDLDEDDEGNIWILTYTGKIIYNLEKNVFKSFNLPGKYNKIPIGCLIYDHNGVMWFGTSGEGVIKYNPKIGKISRFTMNHGLADNYIYSFDLDKSNQLWVNHSESGVSRYNLPSKKNPNGNFDSFTQRNGLPAPGVYSTIQDKEGNYWFGTINGLVQLISMQIELWTENQGLVNNLVWSILIDKNNNKWFGSMGGLTKIESNTGKAISFTKLNKKYFGDVWDLKQSNDGIIWFGCSQGILSIDPKTNKIEQIKLPSYFQSMYMSAYCYSKNNDMWIASYYDGLIKYNLSNNSFIHFKSKTGKIPSDSVSYIFEDSKSNIWAGFSNKGLAKYDGEKFRILESPIQSLDYMIEGTKNDYWIIDSQSQLFRFINGKFINYSEGFGLTGNIIYSLIADTNSLWIGTTAGIARHIYGDSTFNFYGINQGYPIPESNARAAFKGKEGNIWFGTVSGALCYNPEKHSYNPIPPQTHLIGLKLFQEDIEFPENATFDYDDNYIIFKFVGISYTNSKLVKYQYRLLGHDLTWSKPSKSIEAKYAKLSSGKYTFQVKACNSDGIWNDYPTEYQFNIEHPFWLKWWFILLSICFSLFLIYLFIRWRTRYFALIKSQLQEEIDARNVDLQIEKQQLATTLKSIGDGVITTDKVGNITLINDRAKSILDLDKQNNHDKHFDNILTFRKDNSDDTISDPFEYLISDQEQQHQNVELLLKTVIGRQKSILISNALLNDDAGNFFGVVFVLRDVTDQKALEDELQKKQKLESLGILAGGIAHDFNNILTAIIGNLSLAKFLIQPENELYELIDSAENASSQAKGLTQQLLTFAKGGTPVKGIFSIEDIIHDFVGFTLSGSNVKYHTQFEENLPLIEVDSGQINQVIQNLIINADQAMPTGGNLYINVKIAKILNSKVLELKPGTYIQIDIKDEGIGIQKNHLNKIFDPFFSTKIKGSGLGLSTSYSIINKHGGLLSVISKLEKGTTFTIMLPVNEKIKSRKSNKENIKKDLSGKGRILIMDDEKIIHGITSNILKKNGYEVVESFNGDETIEQYIHAKQIKKPFAAVILDLTIPGGMGGKETIKKLMEIDLDVKAIVSSGYSNDEVMSDFSKYGFKACLKKPYNSFELLKSLKNILS
jgi:PAS domain S-box-containing protein